MCGARAVSKTALGRSKGSTHRQSRSLRAFVADRVRERVPRVDRSQSSARRDEPLAVEPHPPAPGTRYEEAARLVDSPDAQEDIILPVRARGVCSSTAYLHDQVHSGLEASSPTRMFAAGQAMLQPASLRADVSRRRSAEARGDDSPRRSLTRRTTNRSTAPSVGISRGRVRRSCRERRGRLRAPAATAGGGGSRRPRRRRR
jgi:hypothetical protein